MNTIALFLTRPVPQKPPVVGETLPSDRTRIKLRSRMAKGITDPLFFEHFFAPYKKGPFSLGPSP
jgi:hypothetical protein